MQHGHIKLFRRIQEHELWKEKPFTRGQAWVDMILSADYETHILCKSLTKCAATWGWTVKKVRCFWEYLERHNMVEIGAQQRAQSGAQIKILNYNKFHGRGAQRGAQQGARYINKEIEIILKNKKIYVVSDELIEKFKKAYPNINVKSELKKLAMWNESNPSKRKTKAGILRHINYWLSSAHSKVAPKEKSRYEFAKCGSCGFQANSVKKGKECPLCETIV